MQPVYLFSVINAPTHVFLPFKGYYFSFLLFYSGNVGMLPFAELPGGRADQFLIQFPFLLG